MRRVLFVDDEPMVLLGLERMLRSHRDEWDMNFSGSGEEALVRLGAEPFDVVVSDMRMPGMDGAQLLSRVRAEYPHMVRVVLSGHTDQEAAMKVLPVAHQFLAKPCEGGSLKEAIDRACGLQSILGDERIREVIGRVDALPALPRLCSDLNSLIADPEVSLVKVARLVEQDPAMAAKVLHLVNSSFFGLPRRLTSIREAVSYLGLSLLRNLVFSLAMFRAFEGSGSGSGSGSGAGRLPGFSHERMQSHALAVAHVAKRICPAREHADDAFISALLADVGQLVLAAHLPDLFGEIIRHAHASGLSLHAAECERLGVSHAEIGAYLLGLWQLPYAVVEGVAHHHDASRIPPHRFIAADAAYIAQALVQLTDGGPKDPFDMARPALDPKYLESLGVAKELLGWAELAAQTLAGATS